MKIKILLVLYLTVLVSLAAKERMTYTFKTHNFRIELPTHWELKKSLTDHKHKPILIAQSEEDRVYLEIFVYPRQNNDLKLGFIQTLKKLQLWAENYTSLDQEAEFPLYHLEGYWSKTRGFKNKKKMFGYVVYASDGVNLFVIHTYTNANLFPKNFKTLKDIFNGFSLNRNYKDECCNECTMLFPNDANPAKTNCSDYTETDECMIYFQNKPQTISQCR